MLSLFMAHRMCLPCGVGVFKDYFVFSIKNVISLGSGQGLNFNSVSMFSGI